jgi:hypothetical protein
MYSVFWRSNKAQICSWHKQHILDTSGQPRNLFLEGGLRYGSFSGGSKNSVEDRGQRERGTGGCSPLVRVPLNLQISETRTLIRFLRMYFPRNWEFGSTLSKLWNFGGGGVEPSKPPSVRHCWTRQRWKDNVTDGTYVVNGADFKGVQWRKRRRIWRYQATAKAKEHSELPLTEWVISQKKNGVRI